MKYSIFIFSLFVLSIGSCKKEELNPANFYTQEKTILLTEEFNNNDKGWVVTLDSSYRDNNYPSSDSLSFAKIEGGELKLQARRGDYAVGTLELEEKMFSSYRYICFDIEFSKFYNANLNGRGTSSFNFHFKEHVIWKIDFHDTKLSGKTIHILYDTEEKRVYTAIENDDAIEDQIFQVQPWAQDITTIAFTANTEINQGLGGYVNGNTWVKKMVIYTI